MRDLSRLPREPITSESTAACDAFSDRVTSIYIEAYNLLRPFRKDEESVASFVLHVFHFHVLEYLSDMVLNNLTILDDQFVNTELV